MDHLRAHRTIFGLLRMLCAVLVAMSLSGVSHAADEVVENAMHLAETGHAAHADLHPEGEPGADREHYCFGSVHNCGCCASAVAAPPASAALPAPSAVIVRKLGSSWAVGSDGVRSRIDRPPRA